VKIDNGREVDLYDMLKPAYLLWSNDARTSLYGSMRLMPTTGPTLLYDVFRRTFPGHAELTSPGIWEGTRMCLDTEKIEADLPGMDASRAFSLLLVALCECAMAHGIHTMISNYEPHMARIYRRAGAAVDELGRADGYGLRPVCCGAFEVSDRVLDTMRNCLGLDQPLYQKRSIPHSVSGQLQACAA
jgi:acyl homoserine lactone synthase